MQLDTRLGQPDAAGIGIAAGGEHHRAIGRVDLVGEMHQHPVALLLDAADGGLVDQLDAVHFEPGIEAAPQVLVEAAQHHLAAIDECGVDAEAGEDRRELDRHIAAAIDQDRVRQRLEMERLVRGDRQLPAGNVRDVRVAAGRDEDVFRRELALAP